MPAEVLHGRGLGEEFTVMLTAGASVGIKKLSPVIAPEGLVGMVLSTDPSTSQAIEAPSLVVTAKPSPAVESVPAHL